MAVEETIVSQLRFGLVFDNRLWSKLLVSLLTILTIFKTILQTRILKKSLCVNFENFEFFDNFDNY